MILRDIKLIENDYFLMYKEKSYFIYRSSLDCANEMKRAYDELMFNSRSNDYYLKGNLAAILKKYKKYVFDVEEVRAELVRISCVRAFSSYDQYLKMEKSFFHFMSCGKKNNAIKDEIKYLDKGLSSALSSDIDSIICASMNIELAKKAKERLSDFVKFYHENKYSCYKLINEKIGFYEKDKELIPDGLSFIDAHEKSLENLRILKSLTKDIMFRGNDFIS